MNVVVTDSKHDWVELNISHQLNPDGGHASGISVSCLNHGGGGGTGFRDKPAAVNGNSSKIPAACWDDSFSLKTRLIVLCTIRNLISCKPIYCRKICKRSYVSSNLRDNRTLITDEDDNNSMVGSAGRSTKISTRGSSTFVTQEGVFSCNDTNLAVTYDFGSSRTSDSTMTECSKSALTFAMKGSMFGWLSGSGSYSTLRSLQFGSDE